MNIDFILFSGPKIKYNFIDLWGETIFIPCYKNIGSDHLDCSDNIQNIGKSIYKLNEKKQKKSILRCCSSNNSTDQLTEIQVENDSMLFEEFPKKQSDISTQKNNDEYDIENMQNKQKQMFMEKIQKQNQVYIKENFMKASIQYHIPCLFLNSLVKSKYIFLYFHASGQDIKLAYPFLNFIRNSYQVNVLAMEYRSYSIYRTHSATSQGINNDANIIYSYIINHLGFKQQNILVIGRSLGTGIALQLLKSNNLHSNKPKKPRALILISAFSSIKSLVKDTVGIIGSFLTQQNFDNSTNISQIKVPVFAVHGKEDTLIPWQQSQQLLSNTIDYRLENCYNRKKLITPQKMSHSSFDYYNDLIDPLRDFLIQQGVNFYEKNMKGPQIPDILYELPHDYIL